MIPDNNFISTPNENFFFDTDAKKAFLRVWQAPRNFLQLLPEDIRRIIFFMTISKTQSPYIEDIKIEPKLDLVILCGKKYIGYIEKTEEASKQVT